MTEPIRLRSPDRLRAYKLARSLAEQVDAILREAQGSGLHARQLRGAAESLLLNIAEGSAHFGGARRLYHYQTAHADAVECAALLTRLRTRNPQLNIFRARTTAEIVASMLRGLSEAETNRVPARAVARPPSDGGEGRDSGCAADADEITSLLETRRRADP